MASSCGPLGCSSGNKYGGGDDDDSDPTCNLCAGANDPSGGGSVSGGSVGPHCPKDPGVDGEFDSDPCEMDARGCVTMATTRSSTLAP